MTTPGRGVDVVGDVEQAGDEQPVAGDALVALGVAVGGGVTRRGGRVLQDEAALGADRHDDGVLDGLRLDQTEDLGAEVLAPVRPSQPAARDVAEPQVHALDPRRVHEDLVFRSRQGQFVDQPGIELDRQHVLLARRTRPGDEVVGAQRRLDHRGERAQHAVGVEADQRVDVGGDGDGSRRRVMRVSASSDGSNSASNSSTSERAVGALSLTTVSMCDWL